MSTAGTVNCCLAITRLFCICWTCQEQIPLQSVASVSNSSLSHFNFCLSEPGNAEQPGVGVRAHRQASSASVLLRRPDRAVLSATGAAAPQPGRSRSHSQQQQYPGPRPELRPHPGQRRGPADGHNPGGHQRLSPGRGGPVRRLPNRRSLLVGYEILLRGSDRSDTATQGAAAPQEAGMH